VALSLLLVACSGSPRDDASPPLTRSLVEDTTPTDGGDVFTRSDGSSTAAEAADGADGSSADAAGDSSGTGVEDGGTADGSESGSSGAAGSSDSTSTDSPYEIAFQDIGGGVEGGWLTVPLDYDNPDGDQVRLWVTRHRATTDTRAGVLLSNNGGPGVAASTVAENAELYFDEPLLEVFDIVSWDPRGTGVSGGSVDCIADEQYDSFFGSVDITPEDDVERDALRQRDVDFAAACVEAVGEALPHIGTNNSARDMESIRLALGEPQISYLGRSYGSELGGVWATMYPDTVRAAVFDGASSPDLDSLEPVRQQMVGFETVFETFLAECSSDESCVFHNDGDAEGAYDRLLASVDENPIPTVPGRIAVNQEVLTGGVIQAMYNERTWPALERSLADASEGDGIGMLALFDAYNRRGADGTYPNLLESFRAILCADDADRLTDEEAEDEGSELIGVAPRTFPGTVVGNSCGAFPESADPRGEITGVGAGPIVVIGTTGDPSTPIISSAEMAAELEEGILVTVEANRHTAYNTGDCINDIVHQYLIWLESPPTGTVCG
jgi:pimeloyl-ACP methyl ester carboxylesterase